MEGTSIAAFVLLGTLVSKLMDTLKFLTARDWNALITQLGVFALGVLSVFLVGGSQFANDVGFEGVTLAEANGATKVFFGLILTSLLSKVYDFQKAADNKQSSATPPLLPSSTSSNNGWGKVTER